MTFFYVFNMTSIKQAGLGKEQKERGHRNDKLLIRCHESQGKMFSLHALTSVNIKT